MTTPHRAALALLLGCVAAQAFCAPTEAERRGSALAARCAACHGIDGNSPSPTAPNLASQLPAYLVLQLQNFRSGERPNPGMKAIAAALSDAEIDDVAHYYASRPAKRRHADDLALAARGKAVFAGGSAASAPACASCHGSKGQGQGSYPRIASQPAVYTSEQLKVYRVTPQFGNPLANVMKTVAVKLSEDEAAAVAAYLETLP